MRESWPSSECPTVAFSHRLPACSKMVTASETHKNLIRGCLPYAKVK